MENIRKSQGSLTWFVTYYNINSNKIGHYDVLKHREGLIKRLKKQCATKTDFSEKMRREMMYHFWSKCEWELIIEVEDDNHVWLNPWIDCKDLQSVRVDVTNCKILIGSFLPQHISVNRFIKTKRRSTYLTR